MVAGTCARGREVLGDWPGAEVVGFQGRVSELELEPGLQQVLASLILVLPMVAVQVLGIPVLALPLPGRV